MTNRNNPIAAASATYRKATNKIATTLGREPLHSRSPRQDFELLVDDLPASIKERALQWYERGIKRGIAYATDKVVDGTFKLDDDGSLIAPDIFSLKVRTKILNGKWESHKIEIDPEDVGFLK